LSILIVLVGGLALDYAANHPISRNSAPTVVISATYARWRNAQVVAETVATPIEQEVNGVRRMLYMSSQSTNSRQHGLDHCLQTGHKPGQSTGAGAKPGIAGRNPDCLKEVRRQGHQRKKTAAGT